MVSSGLIPVETAVISGEEIQAVNARELHEFLEVETPLNKWIDRRIEDGAFTEGMDFQTFLSESTGGRPSKEYLISLDMAKHLCMLERNDRGKQARQYFIECEKALRKIPSKLMTTEELIILQAQSVMEMKTQVAAHEILLSEHQHELLVVKTRLNNVDGVNIEGTPRQQLNSMIRLYAFKNKISFPAAWEEFTRRFNTAFGTNLNLAMHYFNASRKHPVSRPEYLEAVGRIEDAVRVADKMLNRAA